MYREKQLSQKRAALMNTKRAFYSSNTKNHTCNSIHLTASRKNRTTSWGEKKTPSIFFCFKISISIQSHENLFKRKNLISRMAIKMASNYPKADDNTARVADILISRDDWSTIRSKDLFDPMETRLISLGLMWIEISRVSIAIKASIICSTIFQRLHFCW